MVTRGDRQKHEKNLFDVLNKLEKAGYRENERKSELFIKQTKWLGHEIDEKGIKPNEEKVEAILKLKPLNNTKEFKSFIGAIQNLANFLPKLLEKIDKLRLLKKVGLGRKKILSQIKIISAKKPDANRITMLGTLRERQRKLGHNGCK